nr:RDD family protein [Erythrobacter sp. NAP1]
MATASPSQTRQAAADKRLRQIITPEGIALPIRVAGRGSRLGALVLDFVLVITAMIAIYLLVIWLAAELMLASAFGVTTGASEAVNIFLILTFFLARYGYFLAFELGPRGATWGKRVLGIRVAARGGGRLTPEAVVARNLLRDIELFMPLIFLLVAPSGQAGSFGLAGLVWFLTFMAFPFFNKDALRAGDIIAGTWVVEAPRAKLADALSVNGSAANGKSDVTGARYDFGEAELSIYGEHELQVLERMLREDQPESLAAAHAAICRKIGWDPGAGDERAFLEAFYAQLRAKLEGDMRFGKRKADKFS